MKLTPLDIRHKEFKRAMRGYADVEVDEFLDEVADEFERIFKENIDLRDRLEVLEDQVAGYKRIEETLQKTLISAQASADELKQNSTREAQLIVHEAELQARQLVNEAYTERQGIEQATARLRSAEQDFRFKFRQLLQGYLAHMEGEAPVTGEGDAAQTDFERRAEAVKQAIERDEGEDAPPPVETPVEPAPVAEEPAVAVDDAQPEQVAPERERDLVLPGPDEVTAGDIAEYMPPPASADPSRKMPPAERVTLGESDDLLADVDTGVNENEFKW